MRQCILAIILFFSCVTINAQDKRALLIGIGDYPEEYGWNKIHGHNDVIIIRNTLIKQGFLSDEITELIDADATYDKILSAFQSLIESSNKNDIVYVQFSGHGQRITDTDGDESDRFDEAWIPYDAHKTFTKGVYEGEKHITDDILNEYLTKLRFKIGNGGKIIVIADACHSGTGSRGLEDNGACKRGSSDPFVIPGETANVIRKEKPVDWLFVAACKSYQTNYEYKDKLGEYYGALSYSISSSEEQLNEIKYTDAIKTWSSIMGEITVYPQDIDNEGRPSKLNSNLF